MSMHFTVWPEGRPSEAMRFTSWWRMQIAFTKAYYASLLRPSTARRMRVATCPQGFADAHVVEAFLEDQKAIAPRDGWPRPRLDANGERRPVGDVVVRTHAVV